MTPPFAFVNAVQYIWRRRHLMSATASQMVSLGTRAPFFSLPDANGEVNSIEDFKDSPALLVVFMCNHCPYVKHIIGDFVHIAMEFQKKGVAVVGINSNDANAYPDDAPDQMSSKARELGFTFPFLVDGSQEVAKAYRAACTPDFFLFDKNRKLFYRGQMDDSRPGNGKPITGKDLGGAVDALLSGAPSPAKQKPSLGCNIKWKPGNEPGYFGI